MEVTAASLAVSAGAHAKKVQGMLGHASAAMTMNVYADLFDKDIDEVGSAMDAAYGDVFQAPSNLAKSLPKTPIRGIG